MQTPTQNAAIATKTRELCQTILDQPDLRSALQRVEAFMADDTARAHYERVVSKGQALQQKQRNSTPLTSEEISSFEQDRDGLVNNPVARGFLEAQERLQSVHHSINQYVAKTLELGRVPSEADFDSDGCGDGCGCGHHH